MRYNTTGCLCRSGQINRLVIFKFAANILNLVERVGIEPTCLGRPLGYSQLERHCSIHSIFWRRAEESNPIPFLRTWFSRPVAGPTPLHYFPYRNTLHNMFLYGTRNKNRTYTNRVKVCCAATTPFGIILTLQIFKELIS